MKKLTQLFKQTSNETWLRLLANNCAESFFSDVPLGIDNDLAVPLLSRDEERAIIAQHKTTVERKLYNSVVCDYMYQLQQCVEIAIVIEQSVSVLAQKLNDLCMLGYSLAGLESVFDAVLQGTKVVDHQAVDDALEGYCKSHILVTAQREGNRINLGIDDDAKIMLCVTSAHLKKELQHAKGFYQAIQESLEENGLGIKKFEEFFQKSEGSVSKQLCLYLVFDERYWDRLHSVEDKTLLEMAEEKPFRPVFPIYENLEKSEEMYEKTKEILTRERPW